MSRAQRRRVFSERRHEGGGLSHARRPGAPSWRLAHDRVEAFLTRTGGQLAPVTFQTERGPVQPYAIAPWADDRLDTDTPAVNYVMGVAAIPRRFDRVRTVQPRRDHVVLVAESGATVRHPIDLDFFAEDST